MAKKNYIQRIYCKDIQMFKAFRACGHLDHKMISSFNISERRLSRYEKSGYLTHAKHIDKTTNEVVDVYKVTERGREFMSANLGEKGYGFYASQSAHHDLQVAERYFSLAEQERENWLTETDLRNSFYELISKERENGREQYADTLDELYKNHFMSALDGAYVDESGELVGVEIVTNSYTDAQVEAKIAFANVMSIQL